MARAVVWPLGQTAAVAVEVGRFVERQAAGRILNRAEVERLLAAAFESPRAQAAIRGAFATEPIRATVVDLADARVVDTFVERLLVSPALWDLIDQMSAARAAPVSTAEPVVSSAEEVVGEIRERSRHADDWLERAAARLTGRRRLPRAGGEALSPETP